jgi:DNA invertase Pin-like site-specific DNA recombinase
MEASVKQVRYIPPNPLLNQSGRPKAKTLRVAAYCRVSTDDDDQLNSYEAQVDYYTQKINDTDGWTLAGIFADEGITGTSTKKRDEFKKMITLCKKGKIDMILTKSVSRFARNTVDCLDTVRQLKSLGIPVFFEKENINTVLQQSEFIITLYSGFAQAESESISANVRWGKRKSMQDGKVIFRYDKLLGYRKGEDGKPEVVPEEAATIRRIYKSYLAGYSLGRIIDELVADGVPAALGVQCWSRQIVQNILTNERYMGDALLQKTYVTDCLSKKTKKNNGELPQYYVTGSHEAIVSRELFNRAQEEMARRANKRAVAQKSTKTERGKFSSKYALTDRLVCGECGTPYRRCTWVRNGVKRIVWRCISRLEFGTKYCKESPTIDEDKLHAAILRAVNRLADNKGDISNTLRQGIRTAFCGKVDEAADAVSIQRRLNALEGEVTKLMELALEADGDIETYGDRFKEAADEQAALKAKLREQELQQTVIENADARLQEVIEIIQNMPMQMNEYDDTLTAMIIKRITVQNAESVKVWFDCGIEMDEIL